MLESIKIIQDRLKVARGEKPADLLIKGGKHINIFNGEITDASLAIYDGVIIGTGNYNANEVHDLNGAYLLPGFIEGHIHIESSKLTPLCFAETVLQRGTTTVIADPHEIANVYGLDGIRYMIAEARKTPLDIYYMLPSCVPATDMETSGATLRAEDLATLIDESEILGIGEMMNYSGTYFGDKTVLAKAKLAEGRMPIDGHAPGLAGRNLNAYLIAGPNSDHECLTFEEAAEKLSSGMRIMIREGSTVKNLETLLPLVTERTDRRCLFVSDDRSAEDLLTNGHLDVILRKAVSLGLDPVIALRMITINTAEAFGLNDRGGFRPGWQADIVAVNNLKEFKVIDVWKRGKHLIRDSEVLVFSKHMSAVKENKPLPVPRLTKTDILIPDRKKEVRVIKIIPEQIITGSFIAKLPEKDGNLVADPKNDICKLTVIERHTGKGKRSCGFVSGLGITKGAFGSTVAHDSHNIIVAGMDDALKKF